MQDVKSLAKEANWTELLSKADRVRPSARNEEWTKLVKTAASKLMDKISASGSSAFDTLDKLCQVVPQAESRYSFLLHDSQYLKKKGEALNQVASACLQHESYGCGTWIEALSSGVENFPKGTARKIALLLGDERFPSETIRFWSIAVKEDAAASCKEPRLRLATLNSLKGATAKPQIAEARQVASRCYPQLKTDLLAELVHAKAHSNFIRNACPVFLSNGRLTVMKKKKCK